MKRVFAGAMLAGVLAVTAVLQGQETPPPTNDSIERAETVSLTTPLSSTVERNTNGYAVPRYYAFDLDAAGGDTKFDIVVANPANAKLQLALVNERGDAIERATRAESGELRFRSFVLGAGRHFLAVEASLEEGQAAPPFTLSFENKGAWQLGEEREPNETLALETVAPIASGMKGETVDDNDDDYFALDVTGPLQLWTLTATGPGANGLVLLNAGSNEQNRATRSSDGEPAEMLSVLLPPGKAHFRISGEAGAWAVTAVPQGPAPLEVLGGGGTATRKAGETDEVEPNNGIERALILPLDSSRAGLIEASDDEDVYRFTLDGETRVHLALSGPADIRLRARIIRVDSNWDAGVMTVSAPPAAEGISAPASATTQATTGCRRAIISSR